MMTMSRRREHQPGSRDGTEGFRVDDLPIPETGQHFSRLIGLEMVSMAGGSCRAALSVRDEHFNRGGVLHGGVLASVLDTVMGGAVVSTLRGDEWTATVQLNVEFMEQVERGRIDAEGRIVRRGRRIAFVEGSAHEGGRHVARATGIWYVWPKSPEELAAAFARRRPPRKRRSKSPA
jgi:uncharacterized protein (TIGR00369 family)